MLETKRKTVTKTQLARELGVSRQSLYYVKKRDVLDEEIKLQIESVLTHHGEYGHKRIALDLKLIYLATIIDQYAREIVGWNISRFHTKDLVVGALQDAVKRTGKVPYCLHSDQGSEYDSQEYKATAEKLTITLSMSEKSSPWQNGHQESFFGRFKTEFGDVRNYDSLPELVEAIRHHIIYYNTERIHTSLKTTPETFKQNYYYSLQKMKGMIV